MPDNPLRMRDLTARFVVTRRTIHRWIEERGFPKGTGRLGRKGKFWECDAIDAWVKTNGVPEFRGSEE